MGWLQIKATDCKYKKYHRKLKEQFINGLDHSSNNKGVKVLKEQSQGRKWPGINVDPESRCIESTHRCETVWHNKKRQEQTWL